LEDSARVLDTEIGDSLTGDSLHLWWRALFDGTKPILWKWFRLCGLGVVAGLGGWGEWDFNAEARRFGERAEFLEDEFEGKG
jgi:hypothetical protein